MRLKFLLEGQHANLVADARRPESPRELRLVPELGLKLLVEQLKFSELFLNVVELRVELLFFFAEVLVDLRVHDVLVYKVYSKVSNLGRIERLYALQRIKVVFAALELFLADFLVYAEILSLVGCSLGGLDQGITRYQRLTLVIRCVSAFFSDLAKICVLNIHLLFPILLLGLRFLSRLIGSIQSAIP